jgi:hypothetical protein
MKSALHLVSNENSRPNGSANRARMDDAALLDAYSEAVIEAAEKISPLMRREVVHAARVR